MNMLFVLSLEWGRFSISEQVAAAHKIVEEKLRQLGLFHKVIFNCASAGAGEKILPFAEKNASTIDEETLDDIRTHYAEVLEKLRKDQSFLANRDVLEMLLTLRRNGHQLAAVLPSKTAELEELLIDARIRDFFEDFVFGYDRRNNDVSGNLTLASLYATAIKTADANYEESFVVADNPDAIGDAVPLHTKAVVAYLDPYVPWDEQSRRISEMLAAGANFTSVGCHTITNLPWFVSRKAEQQARMDLEKVMGRHLQ